MGHQRSLFGLGVNSTWPSSDVRWLATEMAAGQTFRNRRSFPLSPISHKGDEILLENKLLLI
jgi:hypothetical protein